MPKAPVPDLYPPSVAPHAPRRKQAEVMSGSSTTNDRASTDQVFTLLPADTRAVPGDVVHFATGRSIGARAGHAAARRRAALVTKNFAPAGHVRTDRFDGIGTSAAAIAAGVDD